MLKYLSTTDFNVYALSAVALPDADAACDVRCVICDVRGDEQHIRFFPVNLTFLGQLISIPNSILF